MSFIYLQENIIVTDYYSDYYYYYSRPMFYSYITNNTIGRINLFFFNQIVNIEYKIVDTTNIQIEEIIDEKWIQSNNSLSNDIYIK